MPASASHPFASSAVSALAMIAVAAAGCGKEDPGSAHQQANLDAAVVVLPDGDELEGNQRDYFGDLTVDGSDADFTITVHTATGAKGIDVHSPGHSDLGLLDGLTARKVSIAAEPLSGELSLAIDDPETGGVQYLVEPVEPGPLSEAVFGAGLIARGADLGALRVDAWNLDLTTALLRTDAGDVELMPGVPQEAAIDGVTYRAVLLASYTAELQLDGDVSCTGPAERLAFELLKVEPGTADTAALVRPEGVELPTSSCTARP